MNTLPDTPTSNVELKARLSSIDKAREIAADVATAPKEYQHQVDTYFLCQAGRLKLREITMDETTRAELIWYNRPDQADAKTSRYCLVPVEDAAATKKALSAALGVRVVVEKRREIFFYQNVRIHLDRVERLGEFLEFEAVLSPEINQERGAEQVAFLTERFGIQEGDLIKCSYSELLLSEDEA